MITFRPRFTQIFLIILAVTLTGFLLFPLQNPISASEKSHDTIVAQANKTAKQGSGVFELTGAISRPDRDNNTLKPSNLDVYLYKAGSYKKFTASTDEKGKFMFSGIPAERYFILVAVSNFKYMTTERRTIYVTTTVYGTPTPSPTQIDVPVEKNMGFSWHKMIDIKKPGSYRLDLTPNNADNMFDSETDPDFTKRKEAFKEITNASPMEE
jgi:hypothetical protein